MAIPSEPLMVPRSTADEKPLRAKPVWHKRKNRCAKCWMAAWEINAVWAEAAAAVKSAPQLVVESAATGAAPASSGRAG